MLYDLTSLQRDANTRFGFSARRTLAAAQRLYEEHKALTYPRTSSRYLTSDMAPEIMPTAELLGSRARSTRGRRATCACSTCSRSGASSTTRRCRPPRDHPDQLAAPHPVDKMNDDDRRVYDMVVRRFLAVFHPDARVREHARRDHRARRGRGTSSARAASCCSSPAGAGSTASCPRAQADAPTRTRAPISSCRASSRASPRSVLEIASARARRRSRRAATPTPRCSERWRRRASSSTTRSCARR